ncbi:MAG TPA: ABC transporter ATP-binding protein, partial [Candidatus Thermoplasmatota archaeon]|nr:ABC transporter ATP-binding protein [Candidatus Thermoplasmatota archaeon]
MPAKKAPAKAPAKAAPRLPRKAALAEAPAPPKVPERPVAPTFRTPAVKAPAGPPIVARAENLHKWYGKVHALDGVNIDVHKGEVVGFLGPNGAGKTTFTKCLLGFIKPTGGTVQLFGRQVRDGGEAALAKVGLVPDQYDFYPLLTGRQVLDYYARLYRVPDAEREQRIDEVLRLVGMTEHAGRRVREYSHGMKQRLCIGQALVNRPEFIIFDEPTNGLDPRGAYETRELIKQLSKQGTTIFLSSHILTEVEQVCTRVAILSRGRILVQSSVAELRKKLRGNVARVRITLENPALGAQSLPLDKG